VLSRGIRIAWLAALVPVLAGCSVRLPPTESPLTTATPTSFGPTPAASPAETLPPPPAGFESRLPLWIGDVTSGSSIGPFSAGIWIGQLGSEISRLDVADPTGEGGQVMGEHFFYRGPDPDGNGSEATLWLVDRGGQARNLGRMYDFAPAPDGPAAVLARALAGQRDGGMWLVPLHGGGARRIAGEQEGDAAAVGLAATLDASVIVVGRCLNGDGDLSMDAFVDGQARSLDVVGIPLGFDQQSRLVYWPTCTRDEINRMTLDGSVETLIDHGDYNEARVTGDGRYLVAWLPNAERLDQPLIVVDLQNGDRWSSGIDGDWTLTALGDNEFAVLEGSPGAASDRRQPLVVSLANRWAVILPAVGETGG
jgi:hypothetical protein